MQTYKLFLILAQHEKKYNFMSKKHVPIKMLSKLLIYIKL